MGEDFKILKVKADIHPDGDVYIYNKKDKHYYRIGILLPDNSNGFIFMPDGELCSAPGLNPCYSEAKKILAKGGLNEPSMD